MLATLVSIKKNISCGSKLTDVAVVAPSHRAADRIEHKGDNFASRTRLFELGYGDPSRSIIEKIIRASMPKSSKSHRKIYRVFRVKNPSETLEKFEKHREMVKKMAYLQYKSHPRNLVDGNELLLFYDTTISCCSKNKRHAYSAAELCNEPNCRVCRVIGVRFDNTRKNGIRHSRSSETSSESMSIDSNPKYVKRTVIVCRTTAGTKYCRVNELIRCAPGSSSEDIIVQNHNAVLPYDFSPTINSVLEIFPPKISILRQSPPL